MVPEVAPEARVTVVRELLVGVDIGTTMVKAGVIDIAGNELAEATAPTVWRHVAGGTEAQPMEFLASARKVLAEVLATAPPGDITGVGVTSMSETVVLLDAQGQPLSPAVAWHDRRAVPDLEEMRAEFSDKELAHRTGLVSYPLPTVATLHWLTRRHWALRDASVALSVAEWVVSRLGGSVAAEASLASRTGALSVQTREWWPAILSWAGMRPTLFPEVRQAGTSWGTVADPGTELERPSGATLSVAGHDHLVASVGCGVTADDQVLDSCGTAEALLRPVPIAAISDPSAGLGTNVAIGCHVLAGRYCLLVGLPLGLDLIVLLEQLGRTARHGCSDLDVIVLGALDCNGPAPTPPAAARWRSALESAVTAMTDALGNLEALGGPIGDVRATGGWSANPVLHRLKTLSVPGLKYPRVKESGIRGAALLAGLAAGVYRSADDFPQPILSSVPLGLESPSLGSLAGEATSALGRAETVPPPIDKDL